MENVYVVNCPKCRKSTQHMVFRVSKTRGIKLRCLSCGKIKDRYYKADKLEERNNEIKI